MGSTTFLVGFALAFFDGVGVVVDVQVDVEGAGQAKNVNKKDT